MRSTFRNGQSIFGEPKAAEDQDRLIALDTPPRHVDVRYGEALRFEMAGRQFGWRFNGLDNRSLDLRDIAPDGFEVPRLRLYIGRNWFNRP